MEDGLVPILRLMLLAKLVEVLILVVMEDGLVHILMGAKVDIEVVLILVVMEDGLVPKW